PPPVRIPLVSKRTFSLKLISSLPTTEPTGWSGGHSSAPRLGHCPSLPPIRPSLSFTVITASDLELRAGSRLLLQHATFRIAPGDRVGLVGRNGAGKTTLTKVLAGVGQAAAGTVTSGGTVGYLPQDPRTGDLDVLARDRIL